jgi:ABC-type branched-subunit amino acid transport system substrate-binding protein
MTLGMRIRLWARQAPRGDVVVTSAVALVLLVGMLAIVLPTDDPTSSSGPAPLAVSAGGANATAAAGGATGSTVPGGPTAATTVPASQPAGEGASGGASPGSSTATPGDAPASAGTAPRTASDRGVSADTIKLGFNIAQLGGLDATGFGLGMRTDQASAIKAFVDDANRQGGINGRKIVYVTTKVDPLNASSMRDACIRNTDDEKVFTVIDSAATIGASLGCYAEKKTPHIGAAGITVNDRFLKNAGGYLVSINATATRNLYNWTTLQLGKGFLTPGKGKLGILSDDCAPDPETMDNEFKPLLKQKGVSFTEVRVSCDPSTAQQQTSAAALQMRQAGVDRVVFTTIFTSAQTFMEAADAQAWRPKYSVTDMWGDSLDFGARNFPPNSFDGTRTFTYSYSGSDKAGKPLSAGVQRCDKILRGAGLPGVTEQMGRDAEVLTLCDGLQVWLSAMRRAPLNPTRADWVQARQQAGEFVDPATVAKVVYQPGKFDGGDSYAYIEWRKACTCWVQLESHVPAVY